jgi:hypothetical protein
MQSNERQPFVFNSCVRREQFIVRLTEHLSTCIRTIKNRIDSALYLNGCAQSRIADLLDDHYWQFPGRSPSRVQSRIKIHKTRVRLSLSLPPPLTFKNGLTMTRVRTRRRRELGSVTRLRPIPAIRRPRSQFLGDTRILYISIG